jgi:hypothetical protein
MELIGQPTHFLIVQPLGTPQIVIPLSSEDEGSRMIEGALKDGHLWVKPKKQGERHLVVVCGSGTVFMIMTKQEADRAVAAARFAPGNGAPIPRG